MMQEEQTGVSPPEYTGERLDPRTHSPEILQEHAARYVFAARYCSGKRVLDVASGVGYGTDYLRSHGANAVGLEIDEQSVRYARHQYPSSTFVQGSAERMPNDWGMAYDVVVSFETIEHLERADNFLKEVFRCLRPGGLFICSTPNKSLYLFEGHNQFHVKEFYSGEFQRFIGTLFRVRQVFGQTPHPRWQVVFMGLHSIVRKVLRALHIPPLRVTTVFVDSEITSPFEGNSICKERVRSEFLPTSIPSNCVPAFLVVLAEKSSE